MCILKQKIIFIHINLYNLHFLYIYSMSCIAYRSAMRELVLQKYSIIIIKIREWFKETEIMNEIINN